MKHKLLIGTVLILSLGLAGCSPKVEAPPPEEKRISIEMAQSELRDIVLQTGISGTFKASETVDVASKVMGKVLAVNISEGQRVSKGQVLFRVDSQSVQSAIKNAQSALDSAQAAAATSKLSIDRAQEQYDSALINLERTRQLYEAGAVPLTQLEQAELAASPVNLELARAQYYQSEVAVANASRSLSDASSNLADYTVTAPISGVVTRVNVNAGNVISGGPAVSISNLSVLTLETNVSENLINYFTVGQQVEIAVKSAENISVIGTVAQILPPEGGSLTYPVKINVQSPPAALKAGMFGEIQIATDSRMNAVAVPSDSIVIKDGNTIIYTVRDEKAQRVDVSTGLDNGEFVEIIEGLDSGVDIIVKGQNFVDDGSLVTVMTKED